MSINQAPLHKAMMLTEAVLKDKLTEKDGSELLKLASDLLRVVMRRPTKYFTLEALRLKLVENSNGTGRSV